MQTELTRKQFLLPVNCFTSILNLTQWLNSAITGRYGVLKRVRGVPLPEIAVPLPKVVVPPQILPLIAKRFHGLHCTVWSVDFQEKH